MMTILTPMEREARENMKGNRFGRYKPIYHSKLGLVSKNLIKIVVYVANFQNEGHNNLNTKFNLEEQRPCF